MRRSNNSKSEEKEILKEAKFFLRAKSNYETASSEIKMKRMAQSGLGFWKIGAPIVLTILFLAVATAIASAATIYVPDDYPTIQAAVDNATAGDTITVRDGTYTENVNVDKSLTIKSENGAEKTIVQAAKSDYNIFVINDDPVAIEGFTVKGATGSWKAGIYLNRVGDCNVQDNIILDSYYGIYLHYSSNNALANNIINSNRFGISLYNSYNNVLTGNTASSNSYNGFELRGGTNNTLANNIANLNKCGVYLGSPGNTLSGNVISENQCNLDVKTSQESIDTNNTVDGKPVYYLTNKDGLVIDSSWEVGYLAIVNCANLVIKDLTLTNNGQGVLLITSRNSRIENLTIAHNLDGICLRNSNDNIIIGNIISNNGAGISLAKSSNNNHIRGNSISKNRNGISLSCAWCSNTNNIITDNTISDNLDSGMSSRAHSPPHIGVLAPRLL